jgi:membrane-associated phospholipid phosphatase
MNVTRQYLKNQGEEQPNPGGIKRRMLEKALALWERQSRHRRRSSCAVIFLLALFILCTELRGHDNSSIVPISNLFYNIGGNALGAMSYNYGLNFIGAAAETYLFIETGWDWEWRNLMYQSTWLPGYGMPGLYIGYTVPVIAPITAYIAGRFTQDKKLQITGLALAQSALLMLGIQVPLKMITGRALPGITTVLDHNQNPRSDDFSGDFDWLNLNPIGGWPSSHTASAFATAAIVTEIYHESLALKIILYSYAVFMGLSVTTNVHWASEAVAGALIGHAIGKAVGCDFNRLLHNTSRKSAVSFYASPFSTGVRIAF